MTQPALSQERLDSNQVEFGGNPLGMREPSLAPLDRCRQESAAGETSPSLAISVAIFVAMVGMMAYLRLVVFRSHFITLTYGLPLLLCLWHKDRRLLWSMAAAFIGLSAVKAFYLVPDPDPRDFREGIQWAMQVINIVIVAFTVEVILRLTGRLRAQNRRLEESNEELAASEEEVRQQNEEIQQQSEELNRQNEELVHNSEELEQQSEELHVTNQELNAREAMLQNILASLGEADDERQVLRKFCQTLVAVSGDAVAGAAVVERVAERLVLRMHGGAEELSLHQCEFANSFSGLVMEQGRTAFVDDLAMRPDLVVAQPVGRKFRSVLATPLRVNGKTAGAVEVYAWEPRLWSKQEFSRIEWAAAQCSLALEAVRLRDELRGGKELTEAVNRISQVLHSTLDPEDVVRQIVVEGAAALGSDTAAITERVDHGWLIRYVHRMPGEMIGMRLEDDQERHALLAIKTGEVVWVDDAFNDERFNREHMRRYNVRSVLLAPIVVRGEVFGVMFFNYQKGTHSFTRAEVGFARQLASCAASALGNAQVFEQQRRAEMALREREEEFRAMFAAASVGKVQVDLGNRRLLRVNAAFCRMTGFSEADLLSRKMVELAHSDDRAAAEERTSVMALGESSEYEHEMRLIRADGQIVWVHVSANSIRDSEGKPVRMTAVIQDVTERKRAGQRLQEDLSALMRLHALSLKVLGGGGLAPFLNEVLEAALAIVGSPRGTIQLFEGDSLRMVAHRGHDRPLLEYFGSGTIPSACREAAELRHRVMVPDVEKSSVFGTESLEVLRAARVAAVQSTPIIGRGGKLLGILSTHWDQPYTPDEHDLWRIDLLVRQAADWIEYEHAHQALRTSEERFRVAQELSPDGFTILRPLKDATGQVVDFTWLYQNPAMGSMGGTDPKAVVGRPVSEFVSEQTASRFHDLYKRVLETGKPAIREESYEDVANNKITWFRLAAVPMGVDIAVLSQDITQQKQFQAELERLVAERTARLQELVGELEHFSYTITHDMRAPLRAMRAFAEVVQERCSSCPAQEQKSLLARIITAAERMDALITDSLNYSKTVRQELPLAPVDVAKLLRGILDSYPNLQSSQADISVDGDIPPVMGNEAGLTQCFSNLLGNAVKFVDPDTKAQVRVRSESRDGWVRLWVEDNGIGISASMLPRVFDMFCRGQNSHAGTGIGLALVRKVVDRMGGKVGVESERGKGSRFWVDLRRGDRKYSPAPPPTD